MNQRREAEIFFELGKYRDKVDARLALWAQEGFLSRLHDKDPALWFSEPRPEITDRLGWLDLPELMSVKLEGILRLASDVKAEGTKRVVLLGMGGSSLAAEVFSRSFGAGSGYPRLTVLDSTHPDAVVDVSDAVDFNKTLFIVSSKSGTTLETLSLFRYFWKEAGARINDPGRHFIAITDPGSPLKDIAGNRGFRSVFEAPPDVGGRFSALSVFGLVPAALLGLDLEGLLKSARRAAGIEASGLSLGAALGELAGIKDKITLLTPPVLSSFAEWLEQLIAESTGKEGRGLVPVVNEPYVDAGSYGNDRLFAGFLLRNGGKGDTAGRLESLGEKGHPVIRVDIDNLYALGREFYRWELAIAAAGAVMGIHPFNQPDVQLAKDFTKNIMKGGAAEKASPRAYPAAEDTVTFNNRSALAAAVDSWMKLAQTGDYIAVQAYLAPRSDITDFLQRLRSALLKKTGLATCTGYGPRFLHSTGQLHKGGPNKGLFLQIIDDPGKEVPVPESAYTFNDLIKAQAAGDYQALVKRRRRVLRIDLGKKPLEGLKCLLGLVSR